jgi:heterodisulfide reductase subunit A-like polyferredoxin
VRVQAVARFARSLPNVVAARDYKFMCSDPGQTMIEKDIADLDLTQVVAAAINRVNFHESLQARYAPVHPDMLVVGAGMQAALDIAEAGHKVYLVEKKSTIGGHMLQFDKTFPTLDCAAFIGTPKMVEVSQNRNIELLSYSEVKKETSADFCIAGCYNYHAQIHDLSRYYDGGYSVVHLWMMICLSLGILGPNERTYLGDNLKKVNLFHPETSMSIHGTAFYAPVRIRSG